MNIKIFVSSRIDLRSTRVPNPIYIPVRCGAAFDNNKKSFILGDNTGNNISEKRNSFCEFTVQYWAWKNVEAEYYGLCHYRRYLTFRSRKFRANMQEQIMESFLDESTIKKYDLLNKRHMQSIIEQYDVVVNPMADVTKIPTPNGIQPTVYAHWVGHDQVFLDKRTLPILLNTIQRKFPQYYEAAQSYLNGKWHRGYNCYVMKKNIFYQMCEFQFGILFDLDIKLKEMHYTDHLDRTMGYLGEIMYGIFIYYLQQLGTYKVKEVQLVYFEQTEIPTSRLTYWGQKVLFWIKIHFEGLGYILLPKASKRRNFIKNFYFKLLGK